MSTILTNIIDVQVFIKPFMQYAFSHFYFMIDAQNKKILSDGR